MTPSKLVKAVIYSLLQRTNGHETRNTTSYFDSLMGTLVGRTRVRYDENDWVLDTEVTPQGLVIHIKPNPDSEYGAFIYKQLYDEHVKEEMTA